MRKLDLHGDKTDLWEFVMEDDCGGKIHCQYNFRPSLRFLLETTPYAKNFSIKDAEQYAVQPDIEGITRANPQAEFFEFAAVARWAMKIMLGDVLNQAFTALRQEAMLIAYESSTEGLFEYEKTLTKYLKKQSGRTQDRLKSVRLFSNQKSSFLCRLGLAWVAIKSATPSKKVTQEQLAEAFNCDVRHLRRQIKEYGSTWLEVAENLELTWKEWRKEPDKN